MKQENGAELLGINDPRSANIGIISVSPTDDRRSVLAAILTQEKLGRKQIAIVLPPQNKAFQRPSDFDDLKTIRRNLEAQIIFIIPSGPGPAEFARQRHFAVYSTLENYATALRDGNVSGGVKRGGWLFHRGKPKFLGVTPAAASAPPQSSMPGRDDEDEDIHTDPLKAGGLGAAGFGAGMLAADMFKGGPADEDHTRMFPIRYDDDGDALPPAANPNAGPTSVGAGLAPAQQPPGQAPGPHPTAGQARGPRVPTSPLLAPTSQSDATGQGQGGASGSVQPGKPGGVAENGGANAGGPKIIELNPVRQKVTAKLSPAELAAHQPPMPPADANVGAKANRGRTTGKMAAAAMVGAGVGAASMASGPAPQQRMGGVGNFPPPPGPGLGGRGGGPGRGPRPRRGIVALIAVLLVLLIAGSLTAAAFMLNPNMFKQATSAFTGGGTTVTITPDSKLISNSYVIQGVPGTPDPAQRQIAVRTLTASAKSDPKTVNATGHTQTPGTRAFGQLTFFNGSASSLTVMGGTRIDNGNGAVVVTDTSVFIPAGNPGVSFGVNSGLAHAANAGAAGNYDAGVINQLCCTAGNFIRVKNSAFTGGQDPQNYNFVQQSDVDGVANPLKGTVSAQAQASLQGQLHTGEQFVAQNGSNPCPASVNSDNPIGPHGVNVNSVTVTVTATCNALAYDHAGLQTMVANLLASKANNDIGSTYKLAGQVVMHTTVQNVDQQGNVSLLVNARGIWAAQISDAEKAALAKAIAGKTVVQAQDILAGHKDIGHADIQGGGNVLPSDPNQIKIVIQNVPGVQDTATPAPGGSPVNIPNGTQTPLPGNG
ncbi:MAG TPA: hypothetical protein VKY19_07080 [Ktedonosporobacter sp.]|jgi:hypothetical protein|nr:hypothetical protein [Ktedonosporobacter sp.]